jgi:glutaredoxin
MAKSFFEENKINVKIKDIANEDIREEMKNKFNRVMVPVIIIKNMVFIGFEDNEQKIKAILNK